jgi:hypothetical protein
MARVFLSTLYQQFLKETASIVTTFDAVLPNVRPFDQSCINPHTNSHQMCVIELHDAWARFCRELIFVSAACRPTTFSGLIVPLALGITHRSQVLPKLHASFPKAKPFWWEPRWGDAGACLDAAKRLKVNNYADISSGLTITPSPAENLRHVRNFFAHKSQGTALKVKNVAATMALPNASALSLVETTVPPGITILTKWVDQLHDMARIACS